MIASELIVSLCANVVAFGWVIWQQVEMRRRDKVLDSAETALEAADKAVDLYQHALTDVAYGHATLEVKDNGIIVATHRSAGKVSLH